ncbi:fluoride efflux transporter FluC [Streptomyces fuscigenes]|uniref:fluoride efflux transporter FluC n=1 Tax=Streptomyces fuscigenes TaxID=1528880 RepID=UPI001F373E7F|nr:CrcB family protein [Streptomyces fuscigenes]MCF3960494.1 CrcB family protein [Streptomyces fuscigenes]
MSSDNSLAQAPEPMDPDVGLSHGRQRREQRRSQYGLLAVIAAGGALGTVARYEASLIWPTPVGAFPLTTFVVNVVGCLVIGVFLVAVTEIFTAHPLLRPFFGTGVLGGFTTFSTFCVDFKRLADSGHPATGLVYIVATVAAAMAAVTAGAWTTRRLLAHRRES